MLESAQHGSLATESTRFRLSRDRRWKDLDRDASSEHRVLRQVDRRLASVTEIAEQEIASEGLPRLEGHGSLRRSAGRTPTIASRVALGSPWRCADRPTIARLPKFPPRTA